MINLKWPAPRLPPSPPLRRPAPAPYFHPFLNFSDPPSPLLGGVIKIYFFSLQEGGGGGGYKLCSIIVLCSDDWTHDKNSIFFYNSYKIKDLKSK